MFQNLNNIETAFKHVRLFTFVIIGAYSALCGYCIFYCLDKVSKANDRIYLLSGGQAFYASASTRTENIPIEARDHVKVFHQHFFNLSPDEKAIEATVNLALYMADRSAKDAYDDLKEKGFYQQLVSGNVSQEVTCDSIQVSIASYPYYFKFFGRQRIIRTSAIITRKLITEGYLRSVDRSDNNPHGFLVERWVTLENSDLNYQKR